MDEYSESEDPLVCGIAGRVGRHAGNRESVLRMTQALAHRGPDDDGFYVSAGIELGMRRLSIVDVAGGQQPAFDESMGIVVIFNGEIYNFRSLRSQLIAQGHTFRSRSDTEVIAHLYEDLGDKCLDQLQGMFAIAIWDVRQRRLLLARDRVGKKPLLFRRRSDGGLDFASEARALLRVTDANRAADLSSVNRVLAFGYVGGPFSAFEGLEKLPPGCLLSWQDGLAEVRSYWQPAFCGAANVGDGEVVEEALERIDAAVQSRLVAERPVGAFLSGGIDSTIVTALMARHHAGPVSTFTVGFSSAAFDEAQHARSIAKFLGTDHHELVLEPDPEDLVSRVSQAFDEPFADSSALPTLILSEFARRKVVVALSGDGGDEVFSGYDRYRWLPRLQRTNQLLAFTRPVGAIVESTAEKFQKRRVMRLARELRGFPNLAQRYCFAMSLIDCQTRQNLWTKDALLEIGDVSRPERDFVEAWLSIAEARSDPVLLMSEMDFRSYLPGDLLVKVDIASMTHSLEVRSPLLDHNVVTFAQQLPLRQRIREGRGKWVLQQVARSLVPEKLVDRPKMGFGIPRSEWLRGPLREVSREILTDRTATNRGWFRPEVVHSALDRHAAGANLDNVIWPLLMTELWARAWLD